MTSLCADQSSMRQQLHRVPLAHARASDSWPCALLTCEHSARFDLKAFPRAQQIRCTGATGH
eukprot:12027937-Alexandrium_andersonii.AAC.1